MLCQRFFVAALLRSSAAAGAPEDDIAPIRLRGGARGANELVEADEKIRTSMAQGASARRAGEAELFWALLGGELGHVVDNEGEEVSAHDISLEDCKAACDSSASCYSFTACRGHKCYLKAKRLTGREPSHSSWSCSSLYRTADTYRPANFRLADPSQAPALTFYVYRAQGPAGPNGDYPLANVNTASIGGAMWYLHNEVIGTTDYGGKQGERRFGITRLRRFKLTYKTPQPLWDRGMHFGAKLSFDSGEATGPFRAGATDSSAEWEQFGYHIGCDYLGQWPHNTPPFSTTGPKYPDAIWYSLPGPCPTMDYKSQTDKCVMEQPGGLCNSADGRGNCTYSVEEAGEIDLDELVGIKQKYNDRANFIRQGCFEGDGHIYKNGWCVSFWNDIWNQGSNEWRVKQALKMFHEKYPDMPKDDEMGSSKCDFNYNQYYAN